MNNQQALDLTPRYSLEQCEYQYRHFKDKLGNAGANVRIIKDSIGYLVSLYYSEYFIKERLKSEIIK